MSSNPSCDFDVALVAGRIQLTEPDGAPLAEVDGFSLVLPEDKFEPYENVQIEKDGSMQLRLPGARYTLRVRRGALRSTTPFDWPTERQLKLDPFEPR